VAVGGSPFTVAITPNGALAYVTNADTTSSVSSTVAVINTATNSLVTFVTVGTQPHGVAITPDGAFAYVSNFYNDSVSVIDTASNTVVDTVQGVAQSPEGVAITLRRDALTSRCR
jgi:YVTN family beta-propeller protein